MNEFFCLPDINTDDRPLQLKICSQAYFPVEDKVRDALHRPVRYSLLLASLRLLHCLIALYLPIRVNVVEVCVATKADGSTAAA